MKRIAMLLCLLMAGAVCAQPRSKPEPTPWARPTPTPKPRPRSYNPANARKAKEEAKKAEAAPYHGFYEQKVVSVGEVFTKISYKVHVVNSQAGSREAFIQIRYLDADGFEVESDVTIATIPSGGRHEVTEITNIRTVDWLKITKVKTKIEWMD
jgi:hypothetical protein